ncbi:MAG TPA: hypothetical protein VFA77_11885 [Candidatus Eisenbacteria bacterium]|nr:hypothetical protein [Candidatus Eisenbacteria bacterium]
MLIHLVVQESDAKKNLENPGGANVLSKLGGKNSGLPFFAFADAKGNLIVNSNRPLAGKPEGANIGHPFAPEEVEWFMSMLKQAALKMETAERKTIEDWLKSQKK